MLREEEGGLVCVLDARRVAVVLVGRGWRIKADWRRELGPVKSFCVCVFCHSKLDGAEEYTFLSLLMGCL